MTDLWFILLQSHRDDKNSSQFISAQVAVLTRFFVWLLILTLLPIMSFAQDPERLESIIISGEVNVYQPLGIKPVETGINELTAHFTPTGVANYTEIRYKLWTLVGEPVWTFAAKFPEMQSITLKRGNNDLLYIRRNTFLPEGAVEWRGDKTVTVSPDVMALARVYDFGMHLLIDDRALAVVPETFRSNSDIDSMSISGNPAIYRPFPGILGPAKKWSWDVPGSPEWNNVFRSPNYGLSPTFTHSSYSQNAYDAETNKSIMRRLLYAHGFKNIDVISKAQVGNVKLRLGDLLRAIRKQHPAALDVIYGVKTDEERALVEIIAGFENDIDRNGISHRLSAEASEIEELIQDFRRELSPELSNLWKDVMQRVEKPEMEDSSDEIIKEAAAVFQRSSSSSSSELDTESLASIRSSSDALAALSTSGDDWTRLRNNEIKRSLKLLSMQGDGDSSNLEPFCTLKEFITPMGSIDECDKYGYKDLAGNVVIEPQYTSARHFHHGYAVVTKNHHDFNLIDTKGNSVFGRSFDYMDDMGEFGLVAVRKDYFKEVWSYMDLNGNTVIDTDYVDARSFVNGLARVTRRNAGKNTLYIDQRFKPVAGPFYSGTEFSSHGVAVVKTSLANRYEGDEEFRILKTDGSLMGSYTNAYRFHESGFAPVARTRGDNEAWGRSYEKAWGVIDSQGKVIVPLQYSYAEIEYSDTGVVEFRVGGEHNEERFDTQGKAIPEK